MTIKVSCDKCHEDVKIERPSTGSFRWSDPGGTNHGYHNYAIFTLLGKDRNYTLCEKCEDEFVKWAGVDEGLRR